MTTCESTPATRRGRLRPAALLPVLLWGLFVLVGTAPGSAAERPNFLFIIADDCTYRDVGCYGGQARTPHIDRLAEQGMRFTQSFQAAPMCSPTRHCIYTGLYPVRSGAYPNHTFVKEGTRSIVQFLKPLGYRVALSGKTHIAPRSIFAFEYSAQQNNPRMDAIDRLLSECADSDTPFCLFACSNEPHTPWNKGDPSAYPVRSIRLPDNFVDTPETRAGYAKYLAEISYFDEQVGQCLRLLDKHGLTDNTLVIVTTEQGSSFPFAKWTCYDAGLQNGLIARWPGKIQAGTVSDAIIEYADVVPTFLEAAGGPPAADLDGRSYLPVLLGQRRQHKSLTYALHTTRGIINGSDYFGIRTVRSDKYRLIWNLTPEVPFQNACTQSAIFKSWETDALENPQALDKVQRYRQRPRYELYDVGKDPLNWHNLAGSPELAEVESELRSALEGWMKSQGDLGQATELAARDRQNRNRRDRKKKR